MHFTPIFASIVLAQAAYGYAFRQIIKAFPPTKRLDGLVGPKLLKRQCRSGNICGSGCSPGPCCDSALGLGCRATEFCVRVNDSIGCCPQGQICTSIRECTNADTPSCKSGGTMDGKLCCDAATPFCNSRGNVQFCQPNPIPTIATTPLLTQQTQRVQSTQFVNSTKTTQIAQTTSSTQTTQSTTQTTQSATQTTQSKTESTAELTRTTQLIQATQLTQTTRSMQTTKSAQTHPGANTMISTTILPPSLTPPLCTITIFVTTNVCPLPSSYGNPPSSPQPPRSTITVSTTKSTTLGTILVTTAIATETTVPTSALSIPKGSGNLEAVRVSFLAGGLAISVFGIMFG